MNNRLLPMLLRLAAVVLVVAAIVLFFFDLRQLQGFTLGALPRLFFPPLVTIAIGLLLAGLADVLAHENEGVGELSRSVSRMQNTLAEVQHKVEDAHVALDRLSRNRAPAVTAPQPMHVTAHIPPSAMEPVMKMLAEIRDLSLMTEEERHERLLHMEHERKLLLVRQAIDNIEHQKWSDADHVLRTLEHEHAEDGDVKRVRQQFEDARRNAEPKAVDQGRQQVDNLIGIGSWDQALAVCQRLCNDFPGNLEAQNLQTRLLRERDIHIDSSVSRMVEEIRHDIDRRLWRRALMHAQRLLERFPQHPKTQRMREQLPTLRENAEIEERQELEVRIQELVRSRKFNEAIVVSEELLTRFPTSPQAEQIEVLLPRIRELQKESESSASPAS
jgi:hypothetical protein